MKHSRNFVKFSQGSLFFLVLCSLQACALFPNSRPAGPEIVYRSPIDQRYRVSVKADGQNVENLANTLVHRVNLSTNDLVRLRASDGTVKLPFQFTAEMDNRGEVAGMRVTQDLVDPNFPNMGIKDRDLITALGKKHPGSAEEVGQFFANLPPETSSSLTILRAGEAHKIFYYVSQ